MESNSLDELLAQLGVTPPPMAQRYAPIFNQSPVVPAATGEAMGLPFPSSYMAEVPGSAPAEEPVVEDTTPLGAQMLGYTPQPRPDLAAAITQGPLSELFGRYRDVYSPPQPQADPQAMLSPATTSPQQQRMLAPQQAAMPAAAQPTRNDQRQQILNSPLSESERILMNQSRAYARPISRRRELEAMSIHRGY